MAYFVSKNDSDMIDDLVIDSAWCEEVSPKGLVYDGSYQKTGALRCDVLYGDRSRAKKIFRGKHHLSKDAKVLLFAPTFREGAEEGKRFVFSEVWTIDFKRLINTLEKKFGDTWYLCVRVHPQLAPTFKEYKIRMCRIESLMRARLTICMRFWQEWVPIYRIIPAPVLKPGMLIFRCSYMRMTEVCQ